YYEAVNKASQVSKKVNIISVGWDPGLFAINRVMGEAGLAQGNTYTFWGKGLSQGHSDAVRRVDGVKAGVQYTLPSEEAMDQVRRGENPRLSKNVSHKRDCGSVLEDRPDAGEGTHAIQPMPNYFHEYDTNVHIIREEELAREHQKMPHGGFVIYSGHTVEGHNHIVEYSLKLA